MTELNEQQFAQYSSVANPDDNDILEPYHRLPASMERHAPGEYQPTLPGMEKMLKGEQTHTGVFFKHPNAVDEEEGDVPGSNWGQGKYPNIWHPHESGVPVSQQRPSTPVTPDAVEHVAPRDLHPAQDWMDDNHLHEDPHPATMAKHGGRPLVEKIGNKRVLQDGHHRVVRAILRGEKTVETSRWDAR